MSIDQPPDDSGVGIDQEIHRSVPSGSVGVEKAKDVSVEVDLRSDSGEASAELVSVPKSKASFSSVVAHLPKQGRREVIIEESEEGSFSMIPSDVLDDAAPLWSEFLVGKFVDKAPPVAIIHKIVNQIWVLGKKGVKVDVFWMSSTSVKFRIKDQSTRVKVLSRGSWNIAGVPLVIEKWAPKSELEEEEVVKVVPLWVTMKNIPRALFHEKGFWYLASRIGEPKKLHMDTQLCVKFDEAKMLIDVNLQGEFPLSHRFRSKEGLDVVIEFVYPWVPYKCQLCSKWGHTPNLCKKEKEVLTEQVATQTDKVELPLIQKESSEERVLSEAEVRLDVANGVDAISKEVDNVIDHVSMEKILTVNPLFEKCEGDEHIDELGWQKARSPTRRTQHNIEEDRSIVSPTQFDCLADTTEVGEIRVEEETEQIDKSLKVGGKKETVKSNSDNITVRATRSSSKGSRGAKSGNVSGGRGRGRKPF